MISKNSRDVIKLYKDIVAYGKTLTLTDQKYFLNRVRAEFRKNSNLTSEEEITFHLNVSKKTRKKYSFILENSILLIGCA